MQPVGAPNPDHLRIIDVGAELGALNVLCVSSDPDSGATRDKLSMLMERGERNGIRVKPLREAYPDLNERARAVLRTSKAFLAT